ncbi:hypothetical protein HF086_000550 [Spodoptera exigua]|uniref:GH18 domain-containing protein n=1 Tax=Spodoptera exigua TaxID=7107 RepID=A0A922SKB0_SPOEX|nr:hypothetical protein HF086_000550 [Spodoptera exigua]
MERGISKIFQHGHNYKFDGLDLDWEYPTKRDGKPYDRENFVLLVKELSEAFEPYGYILTAALGAGKSTMETAYDLAKLSRYLDLIHMMCYDYHGTWDGVLGANAPLKGINENDTLSVICVETMNKSSPWVYHWHEQSSTPYLRDGEKVISYDNGRSIAIKVNLVGSKGPAYVLEDNTLQLRLPQPKYTNYALMQTINDAITLAIEEKKILDEVKRLESDNEVRISLVGSKGPAYVLEDNTLQLRLPQPKYTNYALMQTINDAITLAIEEKKILDEVKRLESDNEVRSEDKGGNGHNIKSSLFGIALCALVALQL